MSGWRGPADFDRLIHFNPATSDDVAIQGELPTESLDDITQDVRVMNKGVGIEGGHDTPATKILDVN
jgi:hypothetical protein